MGEFAGLEQWGHIHKALGALMAEARGIDDVAEPLGGVPDESLCAVGGKTRAIVVKSGEEAAGDGSGFLVLSAGDEVDEHVVLFGYRGFWHTDDEFSASGKDPPQHQSQRVTRLIPSHLDEVAFWRTIGVRISVLAGAVGFEDVLFKVTAGRGNLDVDGLFQGE